MVKKQIVRSVVEAELAHLPMRRNAGELAFQRMAMLEMPIHLVWLRGGIDLSPVRGM